jgi:sugar lactone lactonase YvrE
MATHASTRLQLTTATAVVLALSVAACTQPTGTAGMGDFGVTQRPGGTTAGRLLEASGSARIEGVAKGPAGLVGSNIISNAGSGIISNAGSGIISPNTGRYRVAAVKEDPIANAIVYLTDPDERFFAVGGKAVTATTDAKGVYTFSSGLPTDQVIIVNVMLADNRREVGYTVSKAGKNVINVSLATTYVTEFLRDRAGKLGKKMGDFDLGALTELTRLTQAALDAGDLAVPDLGVGKIAEMNQAYALAVGLNKQSLGDAWAKVLGRRVIAITTVAGTGEGGSSGTGKPATEAQLYKPKGAVRDAAGNIYIADEGNHYIRMVGTDGKMAAFSGTGIPRFEGDGGAAGAAGLWWPRTLAVGPNNTLFIADTLNMRIRKVDLATKTITTIAGNPTQANGAFLNDFGGDGGPATQAKLAGVRGMAVDSKGQLVFADTWDNDGGSWHHIRRIKTDGTIETLVGVDGRHGFNGDGKPGRETEINYVNQVALDAQDNIYFADTRNNRVRRYDAASGKVTTVAGNGKEETSGNGGPATEAGINGPIGVAVDTAGRLYICERNGRTIRVVLKDGTIRALAGGGEFTGDGEATAVALSEPHDLFIEPDGNLLVADSRSAKIRRLWLKFGM